MLRDSHPAIHDAVVEADSIHILGAGLNFERPAHQAIHDLDTKGWRLVPVHPNDAGGSILGRPIRPNIEAGTVPEIVVFFLAPERAKKAVMELMVRFPNSFAKVKIENEASRALFESCGFKVKYWLMEK